MPMTLQELTQLENRIGGIPWVGSYPNTWIGSALSLDLRIWLLEKGMPRSAISSPTGDIKMSRTAMEKCYCIKAYFDTVAENKPKKPSRFSIRDALNQANNSLPQSVQTIDQVKNLGELFEEKAVGIPTPIKDPHLNEAQIAQRVYNSLKPELDTLKNNLITNSVEVINSAALETKTSIIKSIEDGSLRINLSKVLEDKILNLVRNTTDEIVLQALRSGPKGITPGGVGASQTGASQQGELKELFPELFPQALPPHANSSFIPQNDPHFYFDPFGARVIRNSLLTSRHVYASGPAGCGKTMLFEQICAVLGHGLFRINPHDGITRGFFLGEMKLKQGPSGSETVFQHGALPTAMKEGLALLIDEFSFLPPALAAVLHPVMERNGKLYIPETGEVITPSPGFVIFATDNTGGKGDTSGQFVGTEVQNTATLDRFSYKLQMDYLPEEKEHEMLGNRFPKQNSSEITQLLWLAREIRQAFSRGELAITLSTRGLIDYFDHREQGFSPIEALNLKLLSWLDDDDELLVKTYCERLGLVLNLSN